MVLIAYTPFAGNPFTALPLAILCLVNHSSFAATWAPAWLQHASRGWMAKSATTRPRLARPLARSVGRWVSQELVDAPLGLRKCLLRRGLTQRHLHPGFLQNGHAFGLVQ